MSPLTRHLALAPNPDPSPTLTPRGRLIGRELELAQLLELFERGERLCTLVGWAGQGKTRLARAVAAAWRSRGEVRVVELVAEANPSAAAARPGWCSCASPRSAPRVRARRSACAR